MFIVSHMHLLFSISYFIHTYGYMYVNFIIIILLVMFIEIMHSKDDYVHNGIGYCSVSNY